MIQSQLLTGAVLDGAIIQAIGEVPRELFVPQKCKDVAYLDEDIAIGSGRYLMEPLVFARLLDLAAIKTSSKVLIVACGTGYSAAVVAKLAAKVVAIDEIRDFAEAARQNIKNLGIANTEIVTTALTSGYAAAAPYDVIIMDGAVQVIPDAIKQQLGLEGRLVTVENVGGMADTLSSSGKCVVYDKKGVNFYRREAFDASVPVLQAFAQNQAFAL